MIGDNTILTIFQNYFGHTVIGVLFFVSVIYCLLTIPKQKKVFLMGILLVILFVFNDLSRILIQFMGEQETYYRFLWILPITPIISYAITDIISKYKRLDNRLIIILGICSIFLLVPVNTLPARESYEVTNDLTSSDIIKICSLINNDYEPTSDSPAEQMLDKRVAVPYDLELELRTYDASISYGISRNAYLYFLQNGYYTGNKKYAVEEIVVRSISYGLPPEDPAVLRKCIADLKIKYLVTPRELNLENYLFNIYCYSIGSSENYTVYRVY